MADEDLAGMCLGMGQIARRASLELQDLSTAVKNRWLLACATALRESTSEILAANALDVARAPEYGLTDAAIDRLADQLAKSNPHAMKDIKRVSWEGTDHWDTLLLERAAISGRLVLSEFTNNAIAQFKKK
jgi:hypothetical protein